MSATSPIGSPHDNSLPAISAYLNALGEALADLDRHERAEVLAGISARIERALPSNATGADALRVLDTLGSVESVAARLTRRPDPASPQALDAVMASVAVPGRLLLVSYGLVAMSLIFLLKPYVSVPLAGIGFAIALRWWRQTRARSLQAAAIVAGVALGFAVIALIVIVLILIAVPAAAGPGG